jgi:hypothetical protein
MPKTSADKISIEVKAENALRIPADVLALKHAQGLYGVDHQVANILFPKSTVTEILDAMPKESAFRLIPSEGKLISKSVLYLGVKPLFAFGYQEIREFGRSVLKILSEEAPDAGHIALTLHGTGYGLDETESFESEVAGILDAITAGDYPRGLRTISIVERNQSRAKRLQEALVKLLPGGSIALDGEATLKSMDDEPRERLRSVGYASASKPYVFVAMPFVEELDDVFHYGINNVVNDAGFLCERADMATFSGDIVEWIRKRIAGAALVVADLSMANPNVYLEVGYAWGCGKSTVLLVRDVKELTFDVKSQRCLVYNRSIKLLEKLLCKELEFVKQNLGVKLA